MSGVDGTLLNGRYRLGAEIDRGGMATVYRAHDTLLKRDVAVKVVSAAAAPGTEGRARLLHEARAAASLNHPNIVSIHDAGEANGSPFIVMELVEGVSLHKQRPDALEEIVAIACQVCAALEYAHAHDVIHRDLKPENVLLAVGGTAKLTDFGLARSVASRLTSDGTIMGTVFYLAPEVALGREFDGRSDLYALGVMLYELTTGRLPFAADDPVAVISQHVHAPVVPPRARNAEIPAALDDLIVRLMSKAPEDRPASATEVLRMLGEPKILERDAIPAEELSVLERIERGRMVGREHELLEARGLWNRALAGQGQVLLITGEPGIGKTRLVRELVTQAEVSGGQALVGISYAEGGAPYAPFRQIIREVLGNGLGEGLSLPDFVLADLLTLAPELRPRYPGLAANPAANPEAEQQRLFENLLIFHTLLSSRAPLLMVLEDAHWADSGTLSLFRHLARHARRQRMMIVATYREVELDQARPLHEVLLDLNRERLATRVKLARLGREETRELLTVLFAEDITPEFLEGIYRETEGNPFFIEEVAKELVESGKLCYEDGRWHRPSMAELGIPQSVRVAIQSRVSKLPPDSQETLHLAAILGREFDFETLVLASELGQDTLLDALERAERAQLIEEVSTEGGGTFAFLHRLVPTTLVEGLRTLQRRRLHGRAAAAIEARRPDSFEALAYHYGQAGNAQKATEYLLSAGDRARALYVHQEAIDSYHQALELLREAGEVERAARTLMKLGLTHQNAFDFQAARQAYEEGFLLWQQATKVESADRPLPAPHGLRVALIEPPTLDPGLSSDIVSAAVIDQLFSGLVELSPEMGVVPDVARSWEMLDEGRKYVFHLRDDVRWSDGVQVTAADFEYAWKRVLSPATHSQVASLLYDIKEARAYHEGQLSDPDLIGVRAMDKSTLAVEVEGPTGYFPFLLCNPVTFPVPRHVVNEHETAWVELGNLVSNGPFRLVAWERGESMVLERNPTYHGRSTGNLEQVELWAGAAESGDLLKMYEGNRLDIFFFQNLPLTDWERARQRHAGEYVCAPSLDAAYVGFDVRRPPFDDLRVRRAFALATDKEALAHVTLRGFAFPATGGFVPPGMPGHSPGIGLRYDPAQARLLLAEAGYSGGRGFPEVEILLPDTPLAVSVVEDLRTRWLSNLGVGITSKQMDWREILDRLHGESPHLWLMGWSADYPDPDNFLRVGEWRLTGRWRNESYDRLIEGARRATDQSERLSMYQQAEPMLVQEAPIIPLYHLRWHLLVQPWVKKHALSPVKVWFWKDVIIEPH
jgi:ABC-type oligopeptide transport system substrate-binding subunit